MSRLVEMLTSVKWLWVMVNLFCSVVLAIQLANILEGYIKPSLTRTWEEELMLRDIDFPVIVKICVIPGFNEKALQEAGYQDTWYYFLGQSMFDNTTYGWAGHANQSETVEEVLAQVADYDIEHIFQEIYVWTKDQESINIPLEHLNASQVNYPHNCRSLSLSNMSELEGKVIQELFIVVAELGHHSLQVQLRGDSLDCRRDIKDHSLYSFGDTIKLEEENVSMAYMVEISQRVFVEEDPANTCQNYPTADFTSYAQCDDAFMRKQIPDIITPIWMAENFSEVSTQVVDENGTLGKNSCLFQRQNSIQFILLMQRYNFG